MWRFLWCHLSQTKHVCCGGFFCNKRLAQRKQLLAGRDMTEEAFKETSSSMLTREDDYGKHVLFFVVFAPSPTPYILLSRPLLQQNACNKWSARWKFQGEICCNCLYRDKGLKWHFATPYFCLYTIQTRSLQDLWGHKQFARKHS